MARSWREPQQQAGGKGEVGAQVNGGQGGPNQRQTNKQTDRQTQTTHSRVARAAVVRGDLAVDEPLERRVAAHVVLLREVGLLGRVDLGDDDRRVVRLERRRGLGVLGRELLAVAAPRRVELDLDLG